MNLKEIIDHIYGRTNNLVESNRPNMFIKELTIYIDYLKGKIGESNISVTRKQKKYLSNFVNNLTECIYYYNGLFDDLKGWFEEAKSDILRELDASEKILKLLNLEIENLSVIPIPVPVTAS